MRTGLGFGGALMSLPFLLLIDNRPLVYLPIIAIQLVFFALLTLFKNNPLTRHSTFTRLFATVDGSWLKKALSIIIVPKLIGVFGLLALPPTIMSTIIFSVVLIYSVTYILNTPFKSNNRYIDYFFLALGGYISGTSLIGAPLIVAVATHQVDKHRLRDTLFALWIILVLIKTSVFIYRDVDLQWINQLWLLPCAAVGHFCGLKFHHYLINSDTKKFYRGMGITLFTMSLIGLWQAVFG